MGLLKIPLVSLGIQKSIYFVFYRTFFWNIIAFKKAHTGSAATKLTSGPCSLVSIHGIRLYIHKLSQENLYRRHTCWEWKKETKMSVFRPLDIKVSTLPGQISLPGPSVWSKTTINTGGMDMGAHRSKI